VQRQLLQTYQGEELETRLKQAFDDARDSLVEQALILEAFEEQGGTLPPQVVDERVNSVIHSRFNDDRAAFLQALEEDRLTPERFRDQIRDQLVVSILRRQEVTDRVIISPRDVRARYDAKADEYSVPAKAKVSMIVLNKGATDEDLLAKKEEAEQVLQRLGAGEDFAAVARDVSEGSRAARGGDWGWVDTAILKEDLRTAADGLEAGTHSGVIDAGDEFYILKVEARQNASVVPFEEVREELTAELRQEEAAKLFDTWIDRLKNKYFVRIYK
jgi:parvulin-like peptidyl-prolyl isomerase